LQASEALRQSQSNEVWLSMPPSLAAKWFAPRMADFLSHHPDISLHIDTSTALADFNRDRVDLAIRYFDGTVSELASELLYRDEASLYCSPAYARKLKVRTPSDLKRATLKHTKLHPHWDSWMEQFSRLSARQVKSIPGQNFDQSIMAIEAARHGQGAVLCSALLTEAEVREGALFEPFDGCLALSKPPVPE
jgi:LysR family glycine cleavage system transcriptional activator